MARADSLLAVVQNNFIRTAVAIQPDHFMSHHHFGPELLRLRDRPRSQFLPGDSSGKTQVVFYLRTGTRLPTGGVRFNIESIQTLRSSVNGRRQTCRSSADDNYIPYQRLIDIDVEAQAISQLLNRWIT